MSRQPERVVVYFTPSDLQVPRVDRQCILRFCDALAEAGCAVEVVSLKVRLTYDEPTRHRSIREVYGLRSHFPIRLLRSPLNQESRDAVGLTRLLWYTVYAARCLLGKRGTDENLIFYFKNARLIAPIAGVKGVDPGPGRAGFRATRVPEHSTSKGTASMGRFHHLQSSQADKRCD